MNDYEPIGPFAATLAQYPELWDLMLDQKLISRAKMCSRLRRPALQALEVDSEEIWEVLARAQKDGNLHEVRKLLGNMMRHIMEDPDVGYRLRSGGPFEVKSWMVSTASRYRAREWQGPFYVHQRNGDTTFHSACIAKKAKLSSLATSELMASDWKYRANVNSERELEFVLGRKLSKYGYVDREDELGYLADWKTVCRDVREYGFVILEH